MWVELMGAQDQIAFKRQLLFSFSHCSCSSLALLSALFSCVLCYPFAQCVFFFISFLSSPQGLDKYSFYLFLISDKDSLHLSRPLSSSLVSVFLSITLRISLASSPSPFLATSLFSFFSFCHRKLPVLSVSPSSAQRSLHSYVSLVGLHLPFVYSFASLLFLVCHSIHLSLLHKRQGVCGPPGCARCHGEACLVSTGCSHHRWP